MNPVAGSLQVVGTQVEVKGHELRTYMQIPLTTETLRNVEFLFSVNNNFSHTEEKTG